MDLGFLGQPAPFAEFRRRNGQYLPEKKRDRLLSWDGELAVNDDQNEPIELGAAHLEPELPKIIPFSTLARCGNEVWIETEGKVYRLRKTRHGKLILTK